MSTTTVETSHMMGGGDEDSANLVSVTVSATATGMHNNTASFSDSDIVTSSSMCSSTTMMATNTKSSPNAVGMTPDIGIHNDNSDNTEDNHHLRDDDDESHNSGDDNDEEHHDSNNNNNGSNHQPQQQPPPSLDKLDHSKIKNLTMSKQFLEEINKAANETDTSSKENSNPISLTMSIQFNQKEENMEAKETPKSLDEILQEFKEIYNYLYVGDLKQLFGIQSIQMNDSQRIRCLGFDNTIELSEHVQRYFQYQIIDFESETDILSITKQFDHFSQLILGRGRNTPVVIHDCCFGLILSSIYLIKYELFSLPQANDLIGYNDFFGTSQKHSHYQKVDSCTLIGDVTTYYYRNMTKRSHPNQKPTLVVEQPLQLYEEKKEKGGFLKKLFNSKKDSKKKPEMPSKQRSASVLLSSEQSKQVQKQVSQSTMSPETATSTKQPTTTTTTTTTTSNTGHHHHNDEDDTPNVILARDSGDDSKHPPIIASCYSELADEYKDIIKKWSLKQNEIEEHWEITLCLLHFQTKLRFFSSQQKVAEANSRKDKRRSEKRQAYLDGGVNNNNNNSVSSVGTLPEGVVSRVPLSEYQLPKGISSSLINITPGSFTKKSLDQLSKKVGSSEIKKIFTIKERVGKGGFGSVYSARNNATKERIAIKKLPHKKSKERKMNTREIRVLDYCKHPNIITYHESYYVSSSDELWVSMEFMEGGTLSEASNQYPFQESNIAYVAREMLAALHYLHSNSFVHRDLKSQNVMMTPSGEIKLIDFGLCASLKSGPKIRMCGSPLWMPPEQIQQKYHSYSADIWSMGVCLLELANRAHKHRKDPLRTMFMVATEGFKQPFEDPNRWSDLFHDFINLCLQFDPAKRPSAIQLLSHPFIGQADNKKKMAKILSSVFLQNIVGI